VTTINEREKTNWNFKATLGESSISADEVYALGELLEDGVKPFLEEVRITRVFDMREDQVPSAGL
jgi:hypothetical protein